MSKLIDKRFLFLLAVVQSLIRVWLSVTPWTEAHQTNSVLHHLLEFAQTHGHWISGAIQPSHPLLPLSPALNLSQHQYLYQWVSSWHQVAKVLELSFLISPSNEYSGLISFRIDLLAVQGTLKSLLQHHSLKASVFGHSAFFTVQLSHLYMTTGKTTALTIQTFVSQVMSLLFNYAI